MPISKTDDQWPHAQMKAERRAELDSAINKAMEAFARMTPEEREAMRQAQRESWVRGEMAIGSDADEARTRDRAREEGEG